MQRALTIAIISFCLVSAVGSHGRQVRAQTVHTEISDPLELIAEIYRPATSLSEDEKRCGLPLEPLSYNNRHPREVTPAVINCLASVRSSKTAWRAFLMAYDAFESGGQACEVAQLLKISRDTEEYSIISSYQVESPDPGADDLLLFARYPFITLSEAKNAYLSNISPGAASEFSKYVSQADACEEELRPYGSEGLAAFVRQ